MLDKLVLSRTQKLVYDQVARDTGRGAREWVGVLRVEGLQRSTINTAVDGLVSLGAITAEREAGYDRRFVLLMAPGEVREGTAREVMRARDRQWHAFVDRDVRPDDGRFMAKLAEVSRPAGR